MAAGHARRGDGLLMMGPLLSHQQPRVSTPLLIAKNRLPKTKRTHELTGLWHARLTRTKRMAIGASGQQTLPPRPLSPRSYAEQLHRLVPPFQYGRAPYSVKKDKGGKKNKERKKKAH